MGHWFPRTIFAALLGCTLGISAPAAEAPPRSPEKLVEQLGSKDFAARREAAYELGRLGPAALPALPALLKALDDEDKQVWSFAMAAIAAMGPQAADAIPVLIDRMGGRRGGRRERDIAQGGVRTADTLAKIGSAAIPPLIQALGDNDGIARIVATRALGNFGPAAKEAIPKMIENLGASQEALREESWQALAQMGPAAGPPLVAALQDPNEHRREGAALALAQTDPSYREAGEKVEQALNNEKSPAVRVALLAALPKSGLKAERCAQLITPSVVGDDEVLRHAALNAMLGASAVRKAAVPLLAIQLKDSNPVVRERSAKALARIGPGAVNALPALMEAAHQSNGSSTYGEALAAIGPEALPSLLAILQSGKPDEAKWVLKTLHGFGPPGVPALAAALRNERADVRASAAAALGEMGPDAAPAADALFALTKDGDPNVQAAALRALVALHADAVRLKPMLQSALASTNPELRRAAAAGLATFGGGAELGVDGLVSLLSDENPSGRMAAVEALGQLGQKAASAVEALAAKLDDPKLQPFILEALAKIGPAASPAVPKLAELAKRPDEQGTILPVLTSIGKGATAALPVIYDALRNPSAEIRASAATALGAVETDNAKAVAALAPLVAAGQSGVVRRRAAEALVKYGPAAKPAVPGLITMLERDTERGVAVRALKAIGSMSVPDLVTMLNVHDPRVRTFACELLAKLGPEAKEAAPKLHELAEQDAALRASATAALQKIEPAPPK